MISLYILLISFLWAGEHTLTFEEIEKMTATKKEKKSKVLRKIKVQTESKSELKKQLKEAQKLLDAHRYVAKMQLKRPLILKETLIKEAQMIGAKTLQAIMASNTKSSVILSNLKGIDIPNDSKLVCDVYAKYKRICGSCNRIIINGEGHNIEATLNNRDGSNCVIGKLSDDREKYLTGVAFSQMAQGALAISQSSIPSIGGSIIENTARNKISQGIINTADEATELMKEEYQTSESIVTLPPNSEVIVLFKKGFSL